MSTAIERIYKAQIQPQQLGQLTYRLSANQKFIIWYNTHYESNWFCLNCEKEDETIMDTITLEGHFKRQIIQCQRCGIDDPQGGLPSTKTLDQKAWDFAQSIISHSFSPEIVKATEKSSEERFQRIQSGESTWEDEEAVLLMQWRALKNMEKYQD